jgi:Tol biopolymer transport system component
LDIKTNQITPLTSGKSTEWFPACSPLGDQIAYWSNAEVLDVSKSKQISGVYNLWKVNLDGTNRVQLTFDETNPLRTGDQNLLVNDAPSWSSDGKKIIYCLGGDIWDMDSDGYNPETLLSGHSAVCPILSPEGRTVVFASNFEDSVFNLWTLTLSDRSLKKMTTYTDWNVGSPSFSADGRKILFNLYHADVTQVYSLNAPDGSQPVNLTNNNRSLCPRYAQNDQKILFCSYGSGEDEDLNVFMASANGTDIKQITVDGGSSPSWVPAHLSTSVPTPAVK